MTGSYKSWLGQWKFIDKKKKVPYNHDEKANIALIV